MENYVITTDNTADLPYSYYKEHQVEYMYLTYRWKVSHTIKKMNWM